MANNNIEAYQDCLLYTSDVYKRQAQGGCPVVLRLTFKDMPMRYRKWTESYSYVTEVGDGVEQIIAGLVKAIIRAPKRQRVYAKAAEKKLILTAMKYDDDESNRTRCV